MGETTGTAVETITIGEYARKHDIESALLRLLAEGGHLPTTSPRRGTYRLPADCTLTAEEAETKGREAYNQLLEATGRRVMKAQLKLRRLLEELEQQQDYLDEVVPLGPGLLGVVENVRSRDDRDWELIRAVRDLIAWNDVLCAVDEHRRLAADEAAVEEMFEHTSLDPEVSLPLLAERSTRPSAFSGQRMQSTPMANELPDGVDDLSPEARRTVLDLLRVLVVAETGNR